MLLFWQCLPLTTCAFRLYSPLQAGGGLLCKHSYCDYRCENLMLWVQAWLCVSVCTSALPDIKGAFLTGAQGAWSWAHAAVHHLLPQIVDFGLKATILWNRKKQSKLCQWHSKTGLRGYISPLAFRLILPKLRCHWIRQIKRQKQYRTLSCSIWKLLEIFVPQFVLRWAGISRGKVLRILRLINDPRNRWFITDLPHI